jgi:transcription antitermination factor NusG
MAFSQSIIKYIYTVVIPIRNTARPSFESYTYIKMNITDHAYTHIINM